MKVLKNSLKIDFNIPSLQKSLSRPQNIRVGRVTGNKTFSFLGLISFELSKLRGLTKNISRNMKFI